jgi:hypothetical protein
MLVNAAQAAFTNVDHDGFRLEAGRTAAAEVYRGATNECFRHGSAP